MTVKGTEIKKKLQNDSRSLLLLLIWSLLVILLLRLIDNTNIISVIMYMYQNLNYHKIVARNVKYWGINVIELEIKIYPGEVKFSCANIKIFYEILFKLNSIFQ